MLFFKMFWISTCLFWVCMFVILFVSHLTKTETPLVILLNIVTIIDRNVHLLPADMRDDVTATCQLHCQWMMVWSEPCQTCRKCCFSSQHLFRQELNYRQQIARQLHTQYAEGIYRHKYYTVTLISRLRVTQGHWKRNHGIDHTRLSRVIWRWILLWPWNVS